MSASRLARVVLVGALVVTVAACGDTATATPSATDATPPDPSVATTPAPSADAAEPPAPSATVEGGGGPVAEAVVARLQADPLIVHVDQVQTVSAGGQDASVVASIDFDGEDIHAVMSVSSLGKSTVQEVVIVGDDAWVRPATTGPFTKVATTALGGLVDQLYTSVRLLSDPQSIRLVGPETIGGMDLQHLTAAGTIPYAPATGEGQYDAFDLWALDDGTPVIARTEFSATDATGVDASGASDFEFSNFGGPITIEPPTDGS